MRDRERERLYQLCILFPLHIINLDPLISGINHIPTPTPHSGEPLKRKPVWVVRKTRIDEASGTKYIDETHCGYPGKESTPSRAYICSVFRNIVSQTVAFARN